MKNLIFSAVILFSLSLLNSSCTKKEEIVGCMDSSAENYNPDANKEGNCLYARDKFLSEFAGQIKCNILITEATDFRMLISEGLSNNNEVQIEFKDTGTPIPIVSARASMDSLIIDPGTYNVPIQGVDRDVEISGFAELKSGSKIEGVLKAKVVGTFIEDVCTFTAEK